MLVKCLFLAVFVVQLNGQEEDPLYGGIFTAMYESESTTKPAAKPQFNQVL
jgi:hypothetical protein